MSGVAGMRTPETVTVSYLGYTIELRGRTGMRILDPSGRELYQGRWATIATARAFIRGYRRESLNEQEETLGPDTSCSLSDPRDKEPLCLA